MWGGVGVSKQMRRFTGARTEDGAHVPADPLWALCPGMDLTQPLGPSFYTSNSKERFFFSSEIAFFTI